MNCEVKKGIDMKKNYKVIVIGAGPAGIGVATALKQSGINDFIVLDREKNIGGVPRHCYHPSFGIKTCFHFLSGPDYIKKILSNLDAEHFMVRATVCSIKEQGIIEISTADGITEIQGERVILATGARETPRYPRLIGGLRPLTGVMTTGTLQQFIYLNKQQPTKHPVIIGTETVSFSALWTLHDADIKVKAMIEENNTPGIWKAATYITKLLKVPIYYHTNIVKIGGVERVEYIEVQDFKTHLQYKIDCDAIIFTGKFIGENTLIRHSHLQQNSLTGCPVVDQYGQCSDKYYFATGNMLHPVDTGENCYIEGLHVGKSVVASLRGDLPEPEKRILIEFTDPRIKFVYPGAIDGNGKNNLITLSLRASQSFAGEVYLCIGDKKLISVYKNYSAERAIVLKNIVIPAMTDSHQVLRLGIMDH